MAKIENLPPPIGDHRVASVRHYEAGPPEGLQLVGSDGETIATTKEEEWISKKKTEVTNTKQIETRVKRQVVLEDGKIVEDSGPLVTTNTTEDTQTQEHHQTELRKLGDNNNNNGDDGGGDKNQKKIEGIVDGNNGKEKWISVPNSDGVVREVEEKRVVSREEIEEIKETEDVQHYGDITDEDFLAAVHSGQADLRKVLKTAVDTDGRKIVSTGPRLVRDQIKSNKVIDTENLKESSAVRADGKIITESQRTTEHEEIYDDELPVNLDNNQQPPIDTHKEHHQRILKVRDQQDVDYVSDGKKIGHEMKYKTETTEMERYGDDDLKHNGIDETDFDRFSQRLRKQQPRRYNTNLLLTTPTTTSPLDRTDAITRKPLDFDQEEEARKVETSKWLEHHFGSESRSSNQSIDDDDDDNRDNSDKKQLPPKTSFFNVTIKSTPIRRTPSPVGQPDYHPVRSDYVATAAATTTTTTANYKGISQWSSPSPIQRQHSPVPDYDNDNDVRTTPIPPQRRQKQRQPEPPPDYSPPRNPTPPQQQSNKKTTRFAPVTTTTSTQTKQKSGNIIGQSIRKLVGKIRSASSERRNAKQRNNSKRSSSPSYQKGHIIDDNNINRYHQPVQRYYLGEDPFAGSIYGRENKYDGVKPRKIMDNDYRSQSTLGRFSKSTIGLVHSSNSEPNQRYSQTLPRRPHQHPKYYKYETPTRLEKSIDNNNDDTINVSIINTISTPPPPPPPPSILKSEPPAKPARTYRSNLARSQSVNIHQSENLKRINNHHHHHGGIDLKSPGLISNLSRSQRDLLNEPMIDQQQQPDTRKRIFLKGLQDRAPELYKKLQENDVHEPPTRLKDHQQSMIRRNSGASSTDYSETYHTTTHNNHNPYKPTITNTTTCYTKKTIPNNRNLLETIESKEIKSVTKRYNSTSSSSPTTIRASPSPVIIEVRNNNYYK